MSAGDAVRSTLFRVEKEGIEFQVQIEKLVNIGISLVAISSLALSLVLPRVLDRESKLFLLLLSTVSSIGLVASLENGEKKYRIYETYQKAQLNSYRDSIQHDIGIDKSIQQIEGERELAAYVYTLPEYEHDRWINRFSLDHLLPLPTQSQEEEVSVNPDIQIPIQHIQLRQQLQRTEEQTELDLSWLEDSALIVGSKVVVSGRGSGKSYYLKYEATRFFIENPNDILIILDPHFNPKREEVAEQWLWGLPIEEIQKYIAKEPEDIYIKLMDVRRELNRRITNSLEYPDVPRIKVILDEEENLKRNLSDEQFKAVQDSLSLIQDEGRKYMG
jgi:hypothetical protein